MFSIAMGKLYFYHYLDLQHHIQNHGKDQIIQKDGNKIDFL